MPVYTDKGDALRGERIAVQAMDIGRVRYGAGLQNHKVQFTTLHRAAYCVIEAPMQSASDAKAKT
jgi:hypothetical protein